MSRFGLNPLVLFLSANLLAGSGEAQTIFTDVTEQVGLDAFPRRSARNVVFADYDNDGFQDVFLTDNEVSLRRIGCF